MRFFKHGDSLAIVLPEPLRKSSNVRDGDEYEFFEIEPGAFVLVSRKLVGTREVREALSAIASRNLPRLPQGQLASQAAQSAAPAAGGAAAKPAVKREFAFGSPEWKIEKEGFAVFENEMEAKRVSGVFEAEIKGGKLAGVRGFDKKFYVVSSALRDSISAKVSKALSQKAATLAELAVETRAPSEAVNAVVQLMKEDGDLIEKKRGVFSLIK